MENTSQPPQFLSVKDFAERFDISVSTVQRMIRRGDLDVVKLSERLFRIPFSAVIKFEAQK